MKFDTEKRMYSGLLEILLNSKDANEVVTTVIKMKTIEEMIKAQGDEIITIISTKDTYIEGVVEDTKPAVSMKDIEIHPKNDLDKPEIKIEVTGNYEAEPEEIPESSPKCEHCKHKEISHAGRGCRYCKCLWMRSNK